MICYSDLKINNITWVGDNSIKIDYDLGGTYTMKKTLIMNAKYCITKYGVDYTFDMPPNKVGILYTSRLINLTTVFIVVKNKKFQTFFYDRGESFKFNGVMSAKPPKNDMICDAILSGIDFKDIISLIEL